MALPFQFVYSHRYDLNLGEHVFPAVKYRLVYERLLAQGLAAPEDFVEPEPVVVHRQGGFTPWIGSGS